jgi:hypothetical protein
MTKQEAMRSARRQYGDRGAIVWSSQHGYVPVSAVSLGEAMLEWTGHGDRTPELIAAILKLADPLESGVYVLNGPGSGDMTNVRVEDAGGLN